MKSIFASKTFWFNALTSVVALAVFAQDSVLLADHPQAVALIGTAIGMVNVVLRLITTKPVSVKKAA